MAELGELLREPLRNGHSARATKEANGIRTLSLTAVTLNDFSEKNTKITSADPGRIEGLWLEPGDILIQRSNTPELVGISALYKGPQNWAIFPDLLIRVRVNSCITPEFAALMLHSRSVRDYFKANAKGLAGSMPKIDQSAIAGVRMPVPPLAEQYRIVETLEDHLSRLDAAQAYLRKSIARLTALRGGLRNIVTRGHKPEATLPNGWSWGTLDDVLTRIEAGKSFRCDPRPATMDEWGVIKVSAMTWGQFRAEEQKAVPVGKGFDPRHEIKPGDILVSRANTPAYVGAPVLVGQCRPQLLLSDKSLRLVPNPGIDKAWLIQVLSSPYVRTQISAKATGTKDSMRNISQRELSRIRVPIPPARDQELIGETLETEMQRVDKLETGLSIAQTREKLLRHALLGRAFSGKLIPQDPADEPASVLLDRIRTEREAHCDKSRRATRRPRKTAAADAPPPPPRSSIPSPTNAVQQELPL
ncbi:restriction endonuclease subunit S [Streptomyces sp. NPDC051776]|uniref:restriction endonuclease subunit S n=1 Tax=Streptomyces sp. NPDC051776 TaxID=3155414 RepID=UPI003431276E